MLALLIRAAISSSSDGDAFEDSVLPSSICVSYSINSQPLNRTELNPRARVLLDQFSIHLFSYLNIRHQFFPNRIVDIWNSSPAAVALSPSVAVFIRNLAKLTFSSFIRYSQYVFICVYYRPSVIACHAFTAM